MLCQIPCASPSYFLGVSPLPVALAKRHQFIQDQTAILKENNNKTQQPNTYKLTLEFVMDHPADVLKRAPVTIRALVSVLFANDHFCFWWWLYARSLWAMAICST